MNNLLALLALGDCLPKPVAHYVAAICFEAFSMSRKNGLDLTASYIFGAGT
jgi:hypothetical protein